MPASHKVSVFRPAGRDNAPSGRFHDTHAPRRDRGRPGEVVSLHPSPQATPEPHQSSTGSPLAARPRRVTLEVLPPVGSAWCVLGDTGHRAATPRPAPPQQPCGAAALRRPGLFFSLTPPPAPPGTPRPSDHVPDHPPRARNAYLSLFRPCGGDFSCRPPHGRLPSHGARVGAATPPRPGLWPNPPRPLSCAPHAVTRTRRGVFTSPPHPQASAEPPQGRPRAALAAGPR